MAVSYCSPLGAVPCQEAWFSIKLTPLPLTVLAIMAVGLPLMVLAFSNAASISSKQWPLMQITSNPKAFSFSSMG